MTGDTITTVNFKFEKETPGALRYQEVDASGNPLKVEGGAKIGTLYVRKSALNGTVPMKLMAALSVVE